jgi:hypothetical protein
MRAVLVSPRQLQVTCEPRQLWRSYIVEVKWRGQLRTDANVYTSCPTLPTKLLFSTRAAHSQPEKLACIREADYDSQYKTQLNSAKCLLASNRDAWSSTSRRG